jgi:hypothetical protein
MTTHDLPFRAHYLCLAVSKAVFSHPTHGVVFVRDAMRCSEAESYGLEPFLLYALSVPGTQIRRMMFSPLRKPRSLYSTLHLLWAQEAEGFRGYPDAVVISRQLAAATSTLGERLARDGIALIVADKGDKVSGAALRTAQQEAMWLGTFASNGRPINTLESLDEAASARHRRDLQINTGKDMQRQDQWGALPVRPAAPVGGRELADWTPGPWLHSWETSLPPVSLPRYLHLGPQDQKAWLLVGSGDESVEDDEDFGEVESDQVAADDVDPAMVKMAKDMVGCWPNGAAEIARSIGTTSRDLKWFLDGKADLDDSILSELLSILGIAWSEHGFYEATGCCVLLANDPGAAVRAYDELSHGGDLAFSFEAVPEGGQADPSWRYLLFQSHGEAPCIMMIERGSKVADRLTDKFFINFEGARTIPGKLYRDLVTTSARACINPLANRRELEGFAERLAAAGLERWP